MDEPEDGLARAERYVREGEARVARQLAIIEDLDRTKHRRAAARARGVLVTLEDNLELMCEYLRLERASRGVEPPWLARARHQQRRARHQRA